MKIDNKNFVLLIILFTIICSFTLAESRNDKKKKNQKNINVKKGRDVGDPFNLKRFDNVKSTSMKKKKQNAQLQSQSTTIVQNAQNIQKPNSNLVPFSTNLNKPSGSIKNLAPFIQEHARQISQRIPTTPLKKKTVNDMVPEPMPQGGNFAFSCKNLKLNNDYSMSAECENQQGVLVKSQIDLNRCIGDDKGVLVKGSGFKKTSKNCKMNIYGKLTCRLVGNTQKGHLSDIDLNMYIENQNGNLQCPKERKIIINKPAFYKFGGNFAHSCKNILIHNKHSISADCKTYAGFFKKSVLSLVDCLENKKGLLEIGRDYQKSTKGCQIDQLGIYTCDGQIDAMKWKRSSIDLNLLVTNLDGNLKCISTENKPNPGLGLPRFFPRGGNFLQNCNNLSLKGRNLLAKCDEGKGKFVHAEIDLYNCLKINQRGEIVPGKGFRNNDCKVSYAGKLKCRTNDEHMKPTKGRWDLNINIYNKNGRLVC